MPRDHVDLRRIDVTVTATNLSFALERPDSPSDPSERGAPVEYWLRFTFQGEAFELVLFGNADAVAAREPSVEAREAELRRVEDAVLLATAPMALDGQRVQLEASFPLDVVRTGRDVYPLPGQVMVLESMQARWAPTDFNGREPGSGPGPAVEATDDFRFPSDALIVVPGAGDGPLQVGTPKPVRFSNGQATTYDWSVSVHNPGESTEVEVSWEAPPDVSFHVQKSFVLQAGASAVLPLYVTVPFRHEHGTALEMTVHFQTDGRTTSLPLTVHFSDIPQPAGHHPVLWLHGVAKPDGEGETYPGRGAYMNAKADEAAGTAQYLEGGTHPCGGGFGQPLGVFWRVPLQPRLVMGLDARPGEPALLDAELWFKDATAGGTFAAKVHVVSDAAAWDGSLNETWGMQSVVGSLSGQRVAATLQVPVDAAMDRLDPRSDRNLELWLAYCVDPDDPVSRIVAPRVDARPWVAAGSTLRLPLDEFHDIVDLSGHQANVRLLVDEPRAAAAPGATVLWRVMAEFEDQAGRYAAELLGKDTHAARLLGPVAFGSTTAIELPVAMHMPEDAQEGDVLEVILSVASQQTVGDAAGLRLSVVVSTEAGRDDAEAAAALEPHKKSPAAPALLVLVLAAAAATRLPRQR